jgi:hypothetical protein
MQCCAVLRNKERCYREAIDHTTHCVEHHTKALQLYNKYKKICDVAYELDIEKEIENVEDRVKHLMHCYGSLNDAFHARLMHRQYAFVPECYDEGHNYQFKMLNNKIELCEKKLENVFRNYQTIQIECEEEIEQELSDKKNESAQLTIQEEIIKEKAKRINASKEEDLLIEEYAKQNKEVLTSRDKMIKLCADAMVKYYPDLFTITPEDQVTPAILLHNLICMLNDARYFFSDFKPKSPHGWICDCKKCNTKIMEIKLGCDCMTKYNDIKNYLQIITEARLRRFYEILLTEQEKLKPIVNDMYNHYSKEKYDLVYANMILYWNVKMNRYHLIYKAMQTRNVDIIIKLDQITGIPISMKATASSPLKKH